MKTTAEKEITASKNMVHRLLTIAAAIAAAATPALADEADQAWTASAAYSRFFADDAAASGDAKSLSILLARRFDATTAAISLGVSRRDAQFPDAVERSDGESFAIGGSLAHAANGAEFALLADYARESADFSIDPVNLSPVAAEGENEFLSLAGSVSRAFGGRTRLIPSASLGWGRSSVKSVSTSGPPGLGAVRKSSGWSGSAGAFLARDVGARWTLSAGAAAIAAQEAGAIAFLGAGGRSRRAGGRFSGLQSIDEAGSVLFGEVGAGLSTRLGRVILSTDAAHSVGLSADYFILTSTISLSS